MPVRGNAGQGAPPAIAIERRVAPSRLRTGAMPTYNADTIASIAPASHRPGDASPSAPGRSSRMLEISDIVTSYGKIEALKGVSLTAAEGRITCLLGPNGAGKTTLMMTTAGILKPRRGRIVLAGADITGRAPADIVARGLALVPENRLVFPQMSVAENLAAGAYQRRDHAAVAEDEERMFQRFPRLEERRSQLAGTLSGGEQQMLAVARALMSRPRILLMDEPSLGLAPLVVEEIFRIVSELNKDGVTVFLVEQNAHMALRLAHHVYLMEQGRVTFSGEPGKLAEDEMIQRAYLGTKKA
jgi:branched-chain amino acid transport system ATP-binding protein